MSFAPEPVPQEETATSTRWLDRGRRLIRRSSRPLGIALLAFVGITLMRGMSDPYDAVAFDAGLLLAVALLCGGVLLLRGQDPVEATATEASVSAERVRRPRSPLTPLTLAAAFVVDGVLILFGNLGVADVGIAQITAASLLIVGVGLLIGSWWGRSRLLILIGLLLIPLVMVTGFVHFPLRGAIGGRYLYPRSAAQIEERYEILAGTLQLDLVQMREFPAQQTIDLEVAAGNVTIFVPERVGLSVNGDIEWGNANVGRGRQQGEDIELATDIEGRPGAGHLTINFHGGIASFYVERISRRERFGRPPKDRRSKQRTERDDRDRPRQERDRERRRNAKTRN